MCWLKAAITGSFVFRNTDTSGTLTWVVHRSEYVSDAVGLGTSKPGYGGRVHGGERHINAFTSQSQVSADLFLYLVRSFHPQVEGVRVAPQQVWRFLYEHLSTQLS